MVESVDRGLMKIDQLGRLTKKNHKHIVQSIFAHSDSRWPRRSSDYPRILLALFLGFDYPRGGILTLFAKMQKKDQLLRAPSSVGRYNSTRFDEGKKSSIILARKMKARTVVGRGEEGPLCDSGSELLLGGRARVVQGQ